MAQKIEIKAVHSQLGLVIDARVDGEELPFSGGPGTASIRYPATLKQVCVHCLRLRNDGDIASRHDTTCPCLMGHSEQFEPYESAGRNHMELTLEPK